MYLDDLPMGYDVISCAGTEELIWEDSYVSAVVLFY